MFLLALKIIVSTWTQAQQTDKGTNKLYTMMHINKNKVLIASITIQISFLDAKLIKISQIQREHSM